MWWSVAVWVIVGLVIGLLAVPEYYIAFGILLGGVFAIVDLLISIAKHLEKLSQYSTPEKGGDSL